MNQAQLQTRLNAIKAAAEGTAAAPAPRKKMTPAERARHASLVRWGKEQPFAARLEAVRQRRAAAKRKKATGGKGKKPKAAAPTPEQMQAEKEQARLANVAALGTALDDADNPTMSSRGLAALDAARKGEEPSEAMASGLIKNGFAERGADGRFRLTSEGRSLLRAADKGDEQAALDAISRASDRASRNADKEARAAEKEKEKAEKPKGGGGKKEKKKEAKPAKEEADEDEPPTDEETASATAAEVGLDEEVVGALREAADGAGADNKELQDLGLVDSNGDATPEGVNALDALERGDARGYRRAVRAAKARKRREQAQTEREKEREASRTKRQAEQDARGTARKKELDERERLRQERSKANQDKRVRAEVERIDAARARKSMDDLIEELEALKADFAAEIDGFEVKAGRRNSGSDQGLIDRGYALAEELCELFETLGATVEEEEEETIEGGTAEMKVGGAVKMTDDDTVFGPAVWLSGTPDTPDISLMKDYFTKSTDFWIDAWERRPMLWHHNMDESEMLDSMRKEGAGDEEIKAMQEALAYLDANPVIGTWTKATVDPIAVWLKGQVNKAHRYRGAIKQMIDSGLIKISTDSAPHLVRRARQPNGTNEVKRWPIVAGSLTTTAAEPRLFDVQAVKSLYDAAGIPLPFAFDNPEAPAEESDRQDAAKALSDDRARRLLLQAKLLQLQE